MLSLVLAPFNLTQGTTIVAKVSAQNSVGAGAYSSLSSGSVIVQTLPSQPSAPINDVANTYQSVISVYWQAVSSPANGGSDIVSYNLQFDNATSETTWTDLIGSPAYSLLTSYQLTSNLVGGAYYNFRLRVANKYGFSSFSPVVRIMAAKVPDDIAVAVSSSLTGTQVSFSWIIPANGGSSILSYLVEFRAKDLSYTTTSS